LTDYFCPGFLDVELKGFKHGSVILPKGEGASHISKDSKQVVAARAFFWIEFPKAWKAFKHLRLSKI
jgi:hypothetical protein